MAMKILHTSDWHLGRSFGSVSLHETQVAFCDWLLATAIEKEVELLVVAGDLYDRPIPPTESVRLWRQTLIAFSEAGIGVVAIAGNHDGADRVAAFDGLTDSIGIHIRGGYDRVGETLTIQDDFGPVDLLIVPFLDPVLAPPTWRNELNEAESKRNHEGVLRLALSKFETSRASDRSVVVSHAFVSGHSEPKISDSEKRLSIGAAEMVSADVYSGHSYVALGHLHRPQPVQTDTIRYSGTPLPYSFTETDPKSVVLVDLHSDGAVDLELGPIPLGRPVIKISGTIEELLSSTEFDGIVDHFVLAELTDADYVTDARDRLTARFPHVVEIRLVGIDRVELDPLRDDSGQVIPRSKLEPFDAAVAFWTEFAGSEPSAEEKRVLVDAFEVIRAEESSR
jgi:exonuclease SbcD